MMNHPLLVLALSLPLAAGSLQGPVRILDPNGKARPALLDAVAMLEPAQKNLAAAGPSSPLSIRTVGKKFLPRVAIITPGTEVSFPNLDHIFHNVFSVTPGNRFDTGHYQPGESPRVRLSTPGLVRLYCNVHHQMNAFLWVVTTPFAELLEGRPGVAFSQVPPGTYRLRLWHPETGEKTYPVTIGEGVTRGEWTLEVSVAPVEPHKNKFGRDYPPPADDRDY